MGVGLRWADLSAAGNGWVSGKVGPVSQGTRSAGIVADCHWTNPATARLDGWRREQNVEDWQRGD